LDFAWPRALGIVIAVMLGISGCAAAATGSGAARVLLVCNGSTSRCPAASHYTTVQAAVDGAHSGDWILIWPGVYHENAAGSHAGVLITTPGLHLRGLSRAGVVIDGSRGNAASPCPSSPALQDFAPRSGIVVWKANGVTIQNLTVCDYLSGQGGEGGNEIWWDGGDATGQLGIKGFHGSYLTATSMYHPADIHDQHLAQYGIYVANSAGPGEISNSYASNMAAGAFYVGACRRACDTTLTGDHGTNSATGYLGTNSGGKLLIENSVFDDNRTGVQPNSLNNDDGPPPQNGLCPGNRARSCAVIENNQIDDNNNADAPATGAAAPVGVGIDLYGAQFNTITRNIITGNESWGVVATDSVANLAGHSFSRCQGGYPDMPGKGLCMIPARGNHVFGNYLSHDGTLGNPGDADLATAGLLARSAVPRNCFYANRPGNRFLTSVPSRIEDPEADGPPCNNPGTYNAPAVLSALACATIGGPCGSPSRRYPAQTRIDYAPLPALPGMPDPCSGLPTREFCADAHQ
jgi:parallel beta-helix repeat protein